MAEEKPELDDRLKKGVEYFEQMLKVMPDDRTSLEFLAVAYTQMEETAKAEKIIAELARVLLKEGDTESAEALLPRLEECTAPEAKVMALKVRATVSPKAELVPETGGRGPTFGAQTLMMAVDSESTLAVHIGESSMVEYLHGLPDNGRVFLVSVLSALEKEKSEACERAIAKLADEFGDVPIPLDAYEPDRNLVSRLNKDLICRRGVIPFATLGKTALVATLSPHDTVLKETIAEALGCPVRFYLAEPRLVEAALLKLYPEEGEKN
ncbi:MAG: hypothetical protein K6G91_05320 [Kiritimatiellae bacterium]|nr:hypothetical protein [Kiritimatiellia bacterium]